MFIPNKLFCQLLDISPKKFMFSKTYDSKFSYIEVWSTDQNPKPLEIEDKINITLVINYSAKYKKWCAIPSNLDYEFGFSSFAKNIGKNTGKNISENLAKNFFIMLNNMQQMHLELLQKE